MKIGKRAESRLRVRLPARVETLEFRTPTVLRDLSRNGARIELAGPPLKPCDIVLCWDRYEAFGRVEWSHSGETGIRFEQAIPAQWLAATRALDDAERLMGRLGPDRRFAKEWATGQLRR